MSVTSSHRLTAAQPNLSHDPHRHHAHAFEAIALTNIAQSANRCARLAAWSKSVRRRRQIGHAAVLLTIRWGDNRTAAKMKIGVLGIAARPVAYPRRERGNLLTKGEFGADGGRRIRENGGRLRCRFGEVGGGFRRRLKKEGSGWLRFAAAVRPRDRSLLNLLNRHRAVGQKPNQNANPAGNTALTVLPTPHAPRTNTKQLRNTLLREAESAERLVKLCWGHAPVSLCPEST